MSVYLASPKHSILKSSICSSKSPARIPAKLAADNSKTLDTEISPPSDMLKFRPARRMPIFQNNFIYQCMFDSSIHDFQKSRLQADFRMPKNCEVKSHHLNPDQYDLRAVIKKLLFCHKSRTKPSSGFRINNRHHSAVLDVLKLFLCQLRSKFEGLDHI